MIPRDYITEWRKQAPWVEDFQVEQDLAISRALVAIFDHPVLRESLAFRGGTALAKLHFRPPARYSEDIDLVQIRAEPAGPMMDSLREVLDPWLGKPQWNQTEARVTLSYRFLSEDLPSKQLRLKVEINSREHFAVYGFKRFPFTVRSRWFDGSTEITSFLLDELLATKLRALYQRRKGRDLFDLSSALESLEVDPGQVVAAFSRYMEHSGNVVTRAQLERNIETKLRNHQFKADLDPLLAIGTFWDIDEAAERVLSRLVALLPDDRRGRRGAAATDD